MDDLTAWYREQLAGRIEALEAARAALGEDPRGEAQATIRRVAHSLRGSGGTFGFPEVTEAAAAVEEASDAGLVGRLGSLLEVLQSVASRPAPETRAVLVIDDDPAIGRILEQRLALPGRRVIVALSAEAAEDVLAREEVALVVLDLVLPDTDGRNLLIRLRERPATAAVPVVVLTVRTSALALRECFALGADQFFEKPFDPDALAAAVTARLQRSAERTRDALRDPLTELPNRAAFHEAFHRAAAFASRQHAPLSIGFVDLDHFKRVNDTYGHAAGDLVLRRATAVLAKTLRESDLLARWGGEEFVALFPDTGPGGAMRALEKARAALSTQEFPLDDEALNLTFSAGVAAVEDGDTLEDAVARADYYLYLAKSSGRDRVLAAGTPVAAPRRNILVAEGDPGLADLIRSRLDGEGFGVLHCPDGEAVLAAFHREPGEISLVILDVVISGGDGFDLLRRLRAEHELGSVPVLVLTMVGREEEVARGLALGADDYVVKPFSPAELLARVHRLLER